jgi:hypothetical protein
LKEIGLLLSAVFGIRKEETRNQFWNASMKWEIKYDAHPLNLLKDTFFYKILDLEVSNLALSSQQGTALWLIP